MRRAPHGICSPPRQSGYPVASHRSWWCRTKPTHQVEVRQRLEDLVRDEHVPLHLLELGAGERALLGENAVAQADHADVMEPARKPHGLDLGIGASHLGRERGGELGHPHRMTGQPLVLGLDHAHQRFEGRDGQAVDPGALLPQLSDQAGDLVPQHTLGGFLLLTLPAPRDGVQGRVLHIQRIHDVGDVVHRARMETADRRPGVVARAGDDHRERRLTAGGSPPRTRGGVPRPATRPPRSRRT